MTAFGRKSDDGNEKDALNNGTTTCSRLSDQGRGQVFYCILIRGNPMFVLGGETVRKILAGAYWA